jgi:predicted esterase
MADQIFFEENNLNRIFGINDKAEKIVSNPIYFDTSKISIDTISKEFILNDRYYLHTIPKNTCTIGFDLILFYHGSRDIAWTQILEYTNLLSINENYIVAFGQASGTINKPEIHPHYGYASFGEIFWEIRDLYEQFDEDLLYTRAIINDMKQKYQIKNVYFIGHSNGGVFALLLALYIPNMFTGIVSHMGGIGYDPGLYLNFRLLQNSDNKTPLLFYTGRAVSGFTGYSAEPVSQRETGEYDIHKKTCESAREIFLGENFPIVDIFIEKDIGHEYLPNCESYILNWFASLNHRTTKIN